ncbi:MAG: inverse autotransporter beta domain-containing protein [Chlamydiota bacterium]
MSKRALFVILSSCLPFATLLSQENNTDLGTLPQRIEIRHIESNGVGYNQGYSTIEGFFILAPDLPRKWVPIADVRAHVFNNGKFAANAGFGLRFLSKRAWGINAYYDYRQTCVAHYNQIGAGVETLGETLDVRLNGYLPVGTTKHAFWKKLHPVGFSHKEEFAMKGLNGELGFHVKKFKRAYLYAAAGPYYFNNQGKNAFGGEARLRLTVCDSVRMQVSCSYDSIFKGVVQGEFGFIFPFGECKKTAPIDPCQFPSVAHMRKWGLQRIDRNEIIVTDKI